MSAAVQMGPLGTSAFSSIAITQARSRSRVRVLRAPVVAREPWILCQVGTADGVHQPLVDAICVARDDDVLAVLARIRARRNDAGQRRAGSLPDVPESRELRDEALHDAEHGLVQRYVDVLALPGVDLVMIESQQRADHAVERRKRVADADADAYGRPVRISRE